MEASGNKHCTGMKGCQVMGDLRWGTVTGDHPRKQQDEVHT